MLSCYIILVHVNNRHIHGLIGKLIISQFFLGGVVLEVCVCVCTPVCGVTGGCLFWNVNYHELIGGRRQVLDKVFFCFPVLSRHLPPYPSTQKNTKSNHLSIKRSFCFGIFFIHLENYKWICAFMRLTCTLLSYQFVKWRIWNVWGYFVFEFAGFWSSRLLEILVLGHSLLSCLSYLMRDILSYETHFQTDRQTNSVTEIEDEKVKVR